MYIVDLKFILNFARHRAVHSGAPKREIAVAFDFCVPENRQIKVNHKGKDVLRTFVRRLYSDMYG